MRTCAADLPDFLELCEKTRKHYQQQNQSLTAIYRYLLELSCERTNKLDDKSSETQRQIASDTPQPGPEDSRQVVLTPSFTAKLEELRDWPVANRLFSLPMEPHRVGFLVLPMGM